jgi:predicted O-methyltransferase YrrM
VSDPQAIVDRLLADPLVVHIVDTADGKQPGVWATEESCYRFIARIAAPAMRTLETGSGLSTALFAAIGTEHTCVTPAQIESDHLRRYFSEQAISGDRVKFVLEPSHVALPRMTEQVDLVLIDGAHGFPIPTLDWFYAGSLLRRGGTMIVDDIPLPAVAALLDFVARDPRWEPLERSDRWAAFRRLSDGPLIEGQWDQPFYVARSSRPLVLRILGRIRRELRARLRQR